MSELDPQQLEAVRSVSRNTLVLAPPGSGKTRVVVERTAYLIEECHTSPFECILLTFTRRAAGEMRERLEKRIGKTAHNLTIGTFHAVALQLLHRFGDLIGFRKENSTVYGEFEESFILKDVSKDIGFFKKTWKIPKRDIDAAFSGYYQAGKEPQPNDPAYPLFVAFMQRIRENNSHCYGTLLTSLKTLLPKIGQYLHWKHVIADEQQDSDLLQWSLLRQMQELCGASLFCVADPDQAIYGWRGSCPEYLIDHQHEFDIHKLTTNYRSVPAIVEASNNLIRHNTSRIDKTMRAARTEHGKVEVWKDCDSARLAGKIVALDVCKVCHGSMTQPVPGGGKPCSNCIENQGCDPEFGRDTAILSRVHSLLKKLSTELTARGIPHTYVGRKTALTNSEEFRRLHGFLKLIVNPYDNFSFLLIKDLLGLSAPDYAVVRVKAATEGMSHFQAWQEFGGASENWTHFFRGVEGKPFLEVLVEIISCLSLQPCPPTDESIGFIHDWITQNPTGTIKQYLDWLATYDLQDDLSEEQEGLVLATIHGVKGLEFNTVIVIGANEGILPSKQAIAAGVVDEERRLAFVAITRARDSLIVAVRPERTEKDGRVFESPQSRFVGEMS